MGIQMADSPAVAGGKPVRKDYLIFGSPAIEQAEIEEVVDSLKSGWLGTGPKVERFEEAFKKYVGAKYAVAVNSCTAALHLALLAVEIQPDDEVITPVMTFTASAAAIIHAAGKPVFVDIDPETMNIDTQQIEPALTENTRAILPVHFAGRPCHMDNIVALAQEYDLRIIEDAAHAIETLAQGRKVGGISDLTCFSFYVTKNVVTGEGGMVTTNNEGYADWIKILALHGMTKDAWHRFSDDGYKHYEVIYPGFKYNMMDIQAAIGLHQLERIEQYALRRKAIWDRYNESFKDLPLNVPSNELLSGDRHAYHLYTLILKLEDLKINRNQFMTALHRENIGTGVHYQALHLHSYYAEKYNLKEGMFPNAEYISDRTVSLPLSAKLSDRDVEDVINAVRRILRYYEK
jgi:dTDP-4-amino-4,6-dideoxygalactose transaminase